MDNSQTTAGQKSAVEGQRSAPSWSPNEHGDKNPPLAAPRFEADHYDAQSHSLEAQAELERPTRAYRDLQSRLLKAQEELEREKRVHGETRNTLQTKDQECQSLRVTWKNLLSEFNRFQAQNQAFASLDDDVLRQKVSQLRYNVRNVALQHFDTEKLPSPKRGDAICDRFCGFFNFEPSKFKAFIETPKTRLMLVQSVLWEYITIKIFHRFRWVDERIHCGLDAIQCEFGRFGKTPTCKCWLCYGKCLSDKSLEDRHSNNGPRMTPEEIQVQRRFNIWKASTTSLLMEATPLEKARARKIGEKVAADMAEKLCRHLSPFSASSHWNLFDELSRVVMEAIDLDLLINRQAAAIDWLLVDETGRKFNPETMEMVGEPGTVVRLVVASGLVRRGKSNGQDFETARCLLKTQVVCGAANVPAPRPYDRFAKAIAKWHG